MEDRLRKTSKFLSLILRHNPGKIGLELDKNGWADIESLISKAAKKRMTLNKALLNEVVETNEKQRFAISSDGLRIRANQGHSIKVDLGLEPKQPPPVLFHGTATRFVESILKQGLVKGKRQHVHLSADIETASKVGKRHGKLAIFKLNIDKMVENKCVFYRSKNGVWLTDFVEPQFLELMALPSEQKSQDSTG